MSESCQNAVYAFQLLLANNSINIEGCLRDWALKQRNNWGIDCAFGYSLEF